MLHGYALLGPVSEPMEARQFVGMPQELSSEGATRVPLPPAKAIFIEEEESESDIFLIRVGAGGVFAGDTWHQSVDEAKEQATFEYGDAVGSWRAMPDKTEDPFAFLAALIDATSSGKN